MFLVYHVQNLRNGKGYIGMTSRSMEARWNSHLSSARQGSPFRFHSAIRKYGPDSFNISVIAENLSEEEARSLEEKEIESRFYQDNKRGYNAKPGGCGGWIVPSEKYESWYRKITDASTGERNPNAYSTTNDELIALGIAFIEKYGFIPGRKRLYRFGASRGVKVPKSWTKYRFGGFAGLVAELEKMTGLKYDPFYRSRKVDEELKSGHS